MCSYPVSHLFFWGKNNFLVRCHADHFAPPVGMYVWTRYSIWWWRLRTRTILTAVISKATLMQHNIVIESLLESTLVVVTLEHNNWNTNAISIKLLPAQPQSGSNKKKINSQMWYHNRWDQLYWTSALKLWHIYSVFVLYIQVWDSINSTEN